MFGHLKLLRLRHRLRGNPGARAKVALLSAPLPATKTAVRYIVRYMDDSDATLRGVVIATLGRASTHEATSAILHHATRGRRRHSDTHAIATTLPTVDPSLLLASLVGLDDTDQQQVISVLDHGSDGATFSLLVSLLGSDARAVRVAAGNALVRRQVVVPLGTVLEVLKAKDARVRADLTGFVRRLRLGAGEAVTALIQGSQDLDDSVRLIAIDELRCDDARAVATLVQCLCERNKTIRGRAMDSLELLLSSHPTRVTSEATAALITIATNDSESGIRYRATRALEQIKDVRAIRPFAAVLREDNSEFRRLAARALGCFPELPTDISHQLIECLADPDSSVRIYAANSLANGTNGHAIEAVCARFELEDAHFQTRTVAARTKLDHPRAKAVIAAHAGRLQVERQSHLDKLRAAGRKVQKCAGCDVELVVDTSQSHSVTCGSCSQQFSNS